MTRKIIGLYQLITGIFGAILVGTSFFKHSKSVDILPQIIAGVALFGLLAWAGYGLLNKRKNSLKYARLLQALQVASFTIGGTMYKFTSAAFIAFGIKNGEFTWGISSQPIDFAITSVQGSEFSIIIYLVPIILLYGLLKIR